MMAPVEFEPALKHLGRMIQVTMHMIQVTTRRSQKTYYY